MKRAWIEAMAWLVMPLTWGLPARSDAMRDTRPAVVPSAPSLPCEAALVECGRALTLERTQTDAELRRTTGTGRRSLHAAAHVDAVSDLVFSGNKAYVAVTYGAESILTEVWIADCSAKSDDIAVQVVPHALMRPTLLATAKAVYLIDALPWGEEEVRSPVRQVPGQREAGFQTRYPCKDGFRPVGLSLDPDGRTVRASCWNGGNAPDGSYEVDL